MTSRLVELEEGEDDSKKSLAWSVFKLCFGVLAVASVFFLEQRLNEAGCRFAVNSGVSVVKGAGVVAVGRDLLNHRFTGYALDAAYLAVMVFILVSSVQGIQSLENGGCEQYFEQHTDVELRPTTNFMNKTEYKKWQKQTDSNSLERSVNKNRDYRQGN